MNVSWTSLFTSFAVRSRLRMLRTVVRIRLPATFVPQSYTRGRTGRARQAQCCAARCSANDIRSCAPPSGGLEMSSESAVSAMNGSPTPRPGLSSRGIIPSPSSATSIRRLPSSIQAATRTAPGRRPTYACRTAFVTASETASLTEDSSGSCTPTARAKAATSLRRAGTEAGTATIDRCSCTLTAAFSPLRPPMTANLHRVDGWLRLRARDQPAEHDDRLRARDARVRPDPLQRGLEMGDVVGTHLHQRVGLAGDGVRRDDLRLAGKRLAQRHRAHVRDAVDLDERLGALAERGRVDDRREARDDAALAQPVDAALDRGRGQAHALAQLRQAQPAVLQELGDDAAVDLVYAAKDEASGGAASRNGVPAASVSSSRSASQSVSAALIVSGGARRTVCSCVSLASTPASSRRSHVWRALP